MVMRERWDAVVVGAGIVGLAHAYHLSRMGQRTLVVERDDQAVGASVRNFGMLWPVGQPDTWARQVALRSRDHWKSVLQASGVWFDECGSLHVAYHEDELQVLREFVEMSAGELPGLRLLGPQEALGLSPAVRPDGLLGGMFSPYEMAVDPRTTVHRLAGHLAGRMGVAFRFGCPVHSVEAHRVRTSSGEIEADNVFVCTGPGYRELLAEHMRHSLGADKLTLCRLHMLRAKSTDPRASVGPHLAAGLTLGHYANFRACPSLPHLRFRLEKEWPEQARHGIHVMVSHQPDGCLTIGDSHEYGHTFSPYRSVEPEARIMEYLDTFLPTDSLTVTERWEGYYPTHPEKLHYVETLASGLHVALCFGTGMTLSFGVAEQSVSRAVEAVTA